MAGGARAFALVDRSASRRISRYGTRLDFSQRANIRGELTRVPIRDLPRAGHGAVRDSIPDDSDQRGFVRRTSQFRLRQTRPEPTGRLNSVATGAMALEEPFAWRRFVHDLFPQSILRSLRHEATRQNGRLNRDQSEGVFRSHDRGRLGRGRRMTHSHRLCQRKTRHDTTAVAPQLTTGALRVCAKINSGFAGGDFAFWRGTTKEHSQGSATEEKRSQKASPPGRGGAWPAAALLVGHSPKTGMLLPRALHPARRRSRQNRKLFLHRPLPDHKAPE